MTPAEQYLVNMERLRGEATNYDLFDVLYNSQEAIGRVITLRGHQIYFDEVVWRYADNNEPTVGAERSCGICLETTGPSGHDPCIGEVPGAINACCGHGEDQEAYIQYPDGVRLDGMDAIRVFRALPVEASDA